jgi:hypothetical protein
MSCAIGADTSQVSNADRARGDAHIRSGNRGRQLCPHRNTQTVDVVMQASPRLPASLTADELAIYTSRRFNRFGDGKTETTKLPPLTFSVPQVTRDEISFVACLHATDGKGDQIQPGNYSGQVRVSGPDGLSVGVMTVTANAKAGAGFWALFAGALVLALALLIAQEARSSKSRSSSRSGSDWQRF